MAQVMPMEIPIQLFLRSVIAAQTEVHAALQAHALAPAHLEVGDDLVGHAILIESVATAPIQPVDATVSASLSAGVR